MMNLTKSVSGFVFTIAIATLSLSHAATITWSGLGDGINWLDGGNWDSGLPSSSDIVDLYGATVQVNGTGATYATGLSGSGGTININSGGVLTQVGSDASALRRFTQVNINNGGTLTADPSVNIRASLTVFTGGTLEGTARMRGSIEFNIDGTFRPGDNSVPLAYNINEGADLIFGSNAISELDIFGNGLNDSFLLNEGSNTIGSTLNLSTGVIQLTPQGYTPAVGHSFDLWDVTNTNSSITAGTGINIILPGFNLDLTSWASDGIVTIASAASVPEPSTYASILGLFSFAILWIRRRR